MVVWVRCFSKIIFFHSNLRPGSVRLDLHGWQCSQRQCTFLSRDSRLSSSTEIFIKTACQFVGDHLCCPLAIHWRSSFVSCVTYWNLCRSARTGWRWKAKLGSWNTITTAFRMIPHQDRLLIQCSMLPQRLHCNGKLLALQSFLQCPRTRLSLILFRSEFSSVFPWFFRHGFCICHLRFVSSNFFTQPDLYG